MDRQWYRAITVGALAMTATIASEARDARESPPVKPTGSHVYATQGILSKGIWKLLLDESNLGGKELELAEVTLAAGTTVGSHTHHSLEAIYVLTGTYVHEVNGHQYSLTPGMVGVVRPGDHVRHIALTGGPTKLLVIWVPGQELEFTPDQAVMIPSLPELSIPRE